jgi:hypothetical protein
MGGWGEYADEARRLWGAMHGAASASSSQSIGGFGLGNYLFRDTVTSRNDERNIRYRRDSDIIRANSSELPMKGKVFLLVNRGGLTRVKWN